MFTFSSTPRTVVLLALAVSACTHGETTAPTTPPPATQTSCAAGTVQLAAAQAARADCANGGTTVTLAGNGASYIIVPQFAVDLVSRSPVAYRLSSSSSASSATSAGALAPSPSAIPTNASLIGLESSHSSLPNQAQRTFDRMLRARAARLVSSGQWTRAPLGVNRGTRRATASSAPVPAIGSVRPFRVLANSAGNSFNTVNSRLAFAGVNLLLYIDTLAPAGGFTADQIQAFGTLFDQTLYPIDTAAFGPPSDVDGNARVIMLMTPAVNALTKAADCATNGFVAGFFDEIDLGASQADTNSNHAEIFYSIVPDPNAVASCAHTTANVGLDVPATFMHELQHLISFSQHFVVRGGRPEYGWLDEGLSIVAEELGSVYYEQKCPGTSCRTSPSQIFPDSSQGFIQSFFFDSYQYALRPDTASVTLHSDSDGGFSWRGGDWLLMRWLGDQLGNAFYRRLEETTATGVANIESAAGQPFPSMFANFGLSLVTDSLPGLPRATAPSANRFVSRNVRQLWARLFATSPGVQVPRAFPIVISAITADTSAHTMVPGTGSYFRLDTPASAATVSIQFAAPGGAALSGTLRPQLAIFRLPPGQ